MSVKLTEEYFENGQFDLSELREGYTKQSYCLGCGDALRRFSLLICAECLEDECGSFLKLAQEVGHP
jgi:hypothetical protein